MKNLWVLYLEVKVVRDSKFKAGLLHPAYYYFFNSSRIRYIVTIISAMPINAKNAPATISSEFDFGPNNSRCAIKKQAKVIGRFIARYPKASKVFLIMFCF